MDERTLRFLQLKCQRAKQVMYDVSKVVIDQKIDVALLQEPWVYGVEPAGLPGTFRRFRSNSGKAAIIVNNDQMDCMQLNEFTTENAVCSEAEASSAVSSLITVSMTISI
ncbi:hypothetical protein TKK_0016671 [Trichogramma kaykai]|uniref:Endonuclease/exonuclease/phosphatase domain-containing protein n=1 Tax=Trichogramma kaykai TaxID=54128 RepID=A0ABD2W5Q8_9HYME